jgi:hypothetical protein
LEIIIQNWWSRYQIEACDGLFVYAIKQIFHFWHIFPILLAQVTNVHLPCVTFAKQTHYICEAITGSAPNFNHRYIIYWGYFMVSSQELSTMALAISFCHPNG